MTGVTVPRFQPGGNEILFRSLWSTSILASPGVAGIGPGEDSAIRSDPSTDPDHQELHRVILSELDEAGQCRLAERAGMPGNTTGYKSGSADLARRPANRGREYSPARRLDK